MTGTAFTGGDKLLAALGKIAEGLETGGELRVGFLEGSTSAPGGLNTPSIALLQEFGAARAGIPPRPFFRPMIAEQEGSWAPKLGAALKATGYNAEAALTMLGEDMRGALADSIIKVSEPALSPVTLMLRKMRSEGGASFVVNATTVMEARRRVAAGESAGDVSTKPLVDTGDMLGAVAFEVKS